MLHCFITINIKEQEILIKFYVQNIDLEFVPFGKYFFLHGLIRFILVADTAAVEVCLLIFAFKSHLFFSTLSS